MFHRCRTHSRALQFNSIPTSPSYTPVNKGKHNVRVSLGGGFIGVGAVSASVITHGETSKASGEEREWVGSTIHLTVCITVRAVRCTSRRIAVSGRSERSLCRATVKRTTRMTETRVAVSSAHRGISSCGSTKSCGKSVCAWRTTVLLTTKGSGAITTCSSSKRTRAWGTCHRWWAHSIA